MPKLFVNSTTGTYKAKSRQHIASALTAIGMTCENLADRDEVRKGVWVLFNEYSPVSVFRGGEVAAGPTVALVVRALEGGLNDAARKRLIAEATKILEDNVEASSEKPQVYVVIHETPEAAWGMNGVQVSLAALRNTANAL